MKRRVLLILCVIAVLLIASACSGGKVYGKDNTDVSADAGKTFTIELDENASTGYLWNYVISDESIVALEKDDSKTTSNRVGAGGKRVLTFKALAKGEAEIALTYERSFEKNPDDEKLVYHISVK